MPVVEPELVLPADLFMLPLDMFEFDMFEFDMFEFIEFEFDIVPEPPDVFVFIVVDVFVFAGRFMLALFVVLSPPHAIMALATRVSAIAVSVFFIVSSLLQECDGQVRES